MNTMLKLTGIFAASIFVLSACRVPAAQNFGSQAAPARITDRDVRVLLVADTHLDPFRDPAFAVQLEKAPLARWPELFARQRATPFATVGHDANPSLLVSAFNEMQNAVPDPDVVFVAGDLLAHDFRARYQLVFPQADDAAYHRFVDKTADITAQGLHALYPHAQILPAVGNNDGYCGDYHSTPRDAFLHEQAAVWQPLADRDDGAPAFAQTYAAGGYYEASLPNGVRLLGVNSILFSDNYENACGDPADHPAESELNWLAAKLAKPQAPPTVMLMHIPPGIDGFKSFLHLGRPVPFYHADVQKRFLDTVEAPDAHVTAVVTGHLHNIAYRVLPRGGPAGGGIPVYSGPSISPIFGNSPAFAELDISAAGRIDDITVYELPANVPGMHNRPAWHRAYDLHERYGLDGLTASSIRAMHGLEQRNLRFRETIEHDRVGGGPAAAIGSLAWRTSWCSELALDPRSYLQCEGVSKTPSFLMP